MRPLDPCARSVSALFASPSRRVPSCAVRQGLMHLGIRLGGEVGGVLGGRFGRGGVVE